MAAALPPLDFSRIELEIPDAKPDANGLIPVAILTCNQTLTDEDIENIKAAWEEAYRNAPDKTRYSVSSLGTRWR